MSERNPTIERPSAVTEHSSLSRRFRDVDAYEESIKQIPRTRLPQPTIAPSVLPDAPFGEMVGFAFKWLLAITIASLFIEVPIGLILYFALR